MPLRDWKDERGWDGVHLLWLSELVRWLRPRLPEHFRAYVGSVPATSLLEPDLEGVARFTFDLHRAIHIDLHGCFLALTARQQIVIDLEQSYHAACEQAYLD